MKKECGILWVLENRFSTTSAKASDICLHFIDARSVNLLYLVVMFSTCDGKGHLINLNTNGAYLKFTHHLSIKKLKI